jgi:hypothetical protein
VLIACPALQPRPAARRAFGEQRKLDEWRVGAAVSSGKHGLLVTTGEVLKARCTTDRGAEVREIREVR